MLRLCGVAFLAWLAVQDDAMFGIGEKNLDKAKKHFEKGEWFDCIDQAERARNIFQALVELYDSQGKTGQRQKCDELVKQCNQLIKLANDKRKADGNKAPTANPDPPKNDKPRAEPPKEVEAKPPEPKKESEPDPALPPPGVLTFGKMLAGIVDPTDAEKVAPMLGELTRHSRARGPWQNFAKIAWVIAIRVVNGTGALAPEDRPAFKEYLEKFLSKADHRGAALHLAKQAETLESSVPRWRIVRLIALAHVAEALKVPDSPLKLELMTKGKPLDLVGDESDKWFTKEGLTIEEMRKSKDAWKSVAKVREPIRDVTKAITLFELMTKGDVSTAKELYADAKSACAVSEASAQSTLQILKSVLDDHKPCKWCEGTHNRRCMNGCDEQGQKVATCNKCNGLGYMMIRGYKIDCQQAPPPGKKWEKAHTCRWPCPKCEGKSTVICKDCKGPWSGAGLLEGLKVAPCELCEGSGWMIPELKLACFSCFGCGKRYFSAAKK